MKKGITLVIVASFALFSLGTNKLLASSKADCEEKLTFLYTIQGRHFISTAEVNKPPTFVYHEEEMEEDTQLAEGIRCDSYQMTIEVILKNVGDKSCEDLLLEGIKYLKAAKKAKDGVQATMNFCYAAALFDELLSRKDTSTLKNADETYHSIAKLKLYEGLEVLKERIVLN